MNDHDHPHPHAVAQSGAAGSTARPPLVSIGIGAGPRLLIWVSAIALLWLAVLWAGASAP